MANQIIWFTSISPQASSAEVKRQWQREERRKTRGEFTSFLRKHGFTWSYLVPGIFPSKALAAGPISSAASPGPGRIPFDQAWSSAERGFHLLAPLSLSWLVAASAPILQQQEEMKEVSSTGTLSGQGQCSDPCKLAPDLAKSACVCVSVWLLPCCSTASDSWQNGQDFVVKHQSHQMKSEDVFFFFFSLLF